MTIHEIYEEYMRQRKEGPVRYNELAEKIMQAIKDEFGFSDNQVNFIYGMVYDSHHAYFEDVIFQSESMARKFQQWDKIK